MENLEVLPEQNEAPKTALTVIANLVSLVMQPLLVPTMAFTIILFGFPTLFAGFSASVKANLLLFICLITLIIPVLTILVLHRFGMISTLMMKKRQERFVPMIIVAFIYMSLAFLLVVKLPINPLLTSVMVSIAFVTIATTFVTFFWQISAHSASMGGLMSLIFLLNVHLDNELMFAVMLLSLIVVGIVMSARLYLNAHTLGQVIAGFALGFITNHLVILRLFGEI